MLSLMIPVMMAAPLASSVVELVPAATSGLIITTAACLTAFDVTDTKIARTTKMNKVATM